MNEVRKWSTVVRHDWRCIVVCTVICTIICFSGEAMGLADGLFGWLPEIIAESD